MALPLLSGIGGFPPGWRNPTSPLDRPRTISPEDSPSLAGPEQLAGSNDFLGSAIRAAEAFQESIGNRPKKKRSDDPYEAMYQAELEGGR